MRDPILKPCEGSGHPGHLHSDDSSLAMCAMCGQVMPYEYDAASDGVMPEHQRQDLLAMIERGDFDD
jgi:hypothetical protein